jgi:hypothetical protein
MRDRGRKGGKRKAGEGWKVVKTQFHLFLILLLREIRRNPPIEDVKRRLEAMAR